MILAGSELKRLISMQYSGLVKVLRSSNNRIEQVGYLYLREGRLEEGYLEDADIHGGNILQAVAEGDYLLETVAGSGHNTGDRRALLKSLTDEVLELLNDYE